MEDTDNYSETPTKVCSRCDGRKKEKIYSKEFLPAVMPCRSCEGTGEVYMTSEEIEYEEECKRDDARDNS